MIASDLPIDLIVKTSSIAGEIFIDIGANIGITCIPRLLLGQFNRVVAVEPEPKNAACLRLAMKMNGLEERALIVEGAVGSFDGTGTLRVDDNIARHSIADGVGGVTIQIRKLDTIVNHYEIPLDRIAFIKVDTEGGEVDVLHGAQELLKARKAAWQLELSQRHLNLSGQGSNGLLEIVGNSFSTFFDLRDRSLRARDAHDGIALTDVLQGKKSYTDVLFFPV